MSEKSAVNDNPDKKAESKPITDKSEEQKSVASKDADSKDKKSKDSDKAEDAQKDDIEDDMDDDAGDLILEDVRESISLTPENARFLRSSGNLISLELTLPGKEPEFFERVVLLRAFPLTNPTEFISVKEPDSKELGNGKEIGMIRYMNDFDEETTMLFLEELDRRYFAPKIKKIHSCREKFGYSYWNVETTAGSVTFTLSNPFANIRILDGGSVLINDIDGNVFEITDPKKLDTASYKKIELYL